MNFKRANTSYSGAERSYNPLWKHMSNEWFSWLNATVGGDSFASGELYVTRRMGAGVEEEDISVFARSGERNHAVLTGPAGIGKTTFLSHARARLSADPALEVLYLDGLSLERDTARAFLLRQIAAELQARIDASAANPTTWDLFWLKHCRDPAGTRTLLRIVQETPSSHEILLRLDDRAQALAKEDPLDWIRVQLAYVRTHLQRTPFLAIDNVDHLSTRTLGEILEIALQLAIGDSTNAPPGNPRRTIVDHGVARVIVAMRPATISNHKQPSVAIATRYRMSPADLAEVLTRRLGAFLRDYQGRLRSSISKAVRSDVVRTAAEHGTEMFDALSDAPPDHELCEAILRMLIKTILPGDHPGGLAYTLHQATNFNLRASLLAAARYVMSGHLDFNDLTAALQGRRALSEFKAFKSLLLGTRSVYKEEASEWALNLLSDGNADATSLLIRLRVLKYVAVRGEHVGVEKAQTVDYVSGVFAYETARVVSTWNKFVDFGLIHESHDDRFSCTDSGRVYLSHLFRHYEYLQHVAVDAFVPTRFHVPCLKQDEDAGMRFRRVEQLADWCREVELDTLRAVKRRGLWDDYYAIFGDDLVCATIAETMKSAAPRLPRPRGESYVDRADRLVARTSFPAMLREADLS